jgi:hypothetical protein
VRSCALKVRSEIRLDDAPPGSADAHVRPVGTASARPAGMDARSDPSGSASLTVGAVTAPRPAGDRLGGWIGLAVASAAHVAALLAFALAAPISKTMITNRSD